MFKSLKNKVQNLITAKKSDNTSLSEDQTLSAADLEIS